MTQVGWQAIYLRALEDPDGFWAEQAALVDWIKRPREVRDAISRLPGASLNVCFNALDRHVVAGRADAPALVSATGTLSYARLLEQVAAFAGALNQLGVQPRDRVLVALPPVTEAVVAVLASARVGAVYVPLAPGAADLAQQVDDARPSVAVLTADDLARLDADSPVERCVVLQRPGQPAPLVEGRDVDVDLALRAGATDPAACVAVDAEAPLCRSAAGTDTRASGAAAVALAWAARDVLGLRPGEVGWVDPDVGPAGEPYVALAPLLAGATAVLADDVADADAWHRVVAQHQVTTVLTTPARLGGLPASPILPALRRVLVAVDENTSAGATQALGAPVLPVDLTRLGRLELP